LDKVIKENENLKTSEEEEEEEEEEEGGKSENQECYDRANEACVFTLLSEECDKELEKKEAKLMEQTKRTHRRESTRMEKRIHDEILKTKKENKVVSPIIVK